MKRLSRFDSFKCLLSTLCFSSYFDAEGLCFEDIEFIMEKYQDKHRGKPFTGRSLKILLTKLVKEGKAQLINNLYFFVDTQEQTQEQTQVILSLDNDYINPIRDRLYLYNTNTFLESLEYKVHFEGNLNLDDMILNRIVRPLLNASIGNEVFTYDDTITVKNIMQERLKFYGYFINDKVIINEIYYISDFNSMMNDYRVDPDIYTQYKR